jgi:hypothetical protein
MREGNFLQRLQRRAVTSDTLLFSKPAYAEKRAPVEIRGVDIGTVVLELSHSGITARGRARILNNTVVSDQGTLLRGVDIWVGKKSPYSHYQKFSQDPKGYEYMRDLGLNAARISIKFNGSPINSVESQLDGIKGAVEGATKAGMYAIVDYHCVASYQIDHLKKFWKTVAPLYKDYPNVIYELANEPSAWSANSYDEWEVRDQAIVYEIIRKAAPNTHIVVLSIANVTVPLLPLAQWLDSLAKKEYTAIDWTNTSVGFHAYNCKRIAYIDNLKKEYPVYCTEFIEPGFPEENLMFRIGDDGIGRSKKKGGVGEDRYIKIFEERGISWLTWITGMSWDPGQSKMDRLFKQINDGDYMWEVDDFSAFK